MTESAARPAAKSSRIPIIDVARGVALIAMAIYHFTWDLEFFGYAERGLTAVGGWKIFARCIASSFLFLVGVSLYLAHRNGIRWPGFWRRWIMVAAAAAVITIGTWFATPDTFIFFGILHQIALASLLGLLFLNAPAAVTFLIAMAVIAMPLVARSTVFDHPSLWWVGLSTVNPHSNDYVPLFPWFGAVLIGIATAKTAMATSFTERLAALKLGRWTNPLVFLGRHSLAFYLIHQPVLIACVWLFAQVVPPRLETPEVRFRQACEFTCAEARDEEFCARYCVCMLDRLESAGTLDRVLASEKNEELDASVQATAAMCTAESETGAIEENEPQ
jgi:uncharacterized membrane protein